MARWARPWGPMTATRPFFAVRGSADEDEDGDGGADTDADDEDGEDGGGEAGAAAAETGASFLRSTRAERVARTFRAWEAAVSTLSATL